MLLSGAACAAARELLLRKKQTVWSQRVIKGSCPLVLIPHLGEVVFLQQKGNASGGEDSLALRWASWKDS